MSPQIVTGAETGWTLDSVCNISFAFVINYLLCFIFVEKLSSPLLLPSIRISSGTSEVIPRPRKRQNKTTEFGGSGLR